MSDIISIFLTISNPCAKTRHYCCNATDQRSSSRQTTLICNHERQARHFRGDQLRQDQAEEDRDAGEEYPPYKRSHRTGEGGHLVKAHPPVMHCTPPPPALPCFQSLLLAV